MVTPNVAYILNLFDATLHALGASALAEERVFTLDRELLGADYHRYRLTNPNEAKLAVSVEVSDAGVTFYLDRTNEIPEWSFAWIAAHPEPFQQVLRDLLSSRVLVQYQGQKTVLRLFSHGGALVRQFSYTEGFFGLNCLHESSFRLLEPLLP